jgi:hypothetical protein
MAALTHQIKTFIVQALACFDTPTQVAEAVKREFNLDVTRQQVETHDPTKRSSKGLARKWRFVFDATRIAFNTAMLDIPVANRAYRLRVLGRMLGSAEGSGNLALAAKMLEQAAREMGAAPAQRTH